jgi:hypothetical protein
LSKFEQKRNKDWTIDNLRKEHINQVCYLGLSRSMKHILITNTKDIRKILSLFGSTKWIKVCQNLNKKEIKIELLTTSEKSISIRYAILVYQDQWNIFWSQTQKTLEKYCLFLGLQNESKSVKIWTKNKLKKNCIFSSLHNESLTKWIKVYQNLNKKEIKEKLYLFRSP